MKHIITIAAATVLFAQPSFARGGGDNDILARGSQAWFVYESAEHVLEALVENGTITQNGVTAVTVTRNSDHASEVSALTSEGQIVKACTMVDESSRGGTVIKKDVRCAGLLESRNDLNRGSDAWAVVEGIEHSLRLAVVADASVLSGTTAVSSALEADKSVSVEITLASGGTLNYHCTRTQRSLNCAAQ